MIKVKFSHNKYFELNQFLIDGSNLERICYIFGYHYQDLNKNIVIIPDTIIAPNNDDNYASSTYVRLDDNIAEYIYREFAKSDHTVIINCHSHPFDSSDAVRFSSIDDRSDNAEYDYLFNKLAKYKNQDFIHLAYLRGNNATAMRLIKGNGVFDYNISIRVIGQQYSYINNSNYIQQQNHRMDEQFLRRAHLFGGQIAQNKLSDIQVAVVGCGGTGSIVAENLVRLGVKHITLIDDDLVEETNLNRLQGARVSDINRYKVDVIAENIRQYARDVFVNKIKTNAFSKSSYNHLKSSDIIFSCVDNAVARFFINQISASFFIPVFNVGVRIFESENHEINNVWRVDIFVPSTTSCMDCAYYAVYDRSNASVKFFDKNTYQNMVRAGYINDDTEIKDPSVYSLNQQAVSQLMNEFHNYFVGFKKFIPHIRGYLSPTQTKSEHSETRLFKVNGTGSCGTCIDYLGKCGKYHDSIKLRLDG